MQDEKLLLLMLFVASVTKLLDFLLPGKSIIYFSYYPGTRVPEYPNSWIVYSKISGTNMKLPTTPKHYILAE